MFEPPPPLTRVQRPASSHARAAPGVARRCYTSAELVRSGVAKDVVSSDDDGSDSDEAPYGDGTKALGRMLGTLCDASRADCAVPIVALVGVCGGRHRCARERLELPP